MWQLLSDDPAAADELAERDERMDMIVARGEIRQRLELLRRRAIPVEVLAQTQRFRSRIVAVDAGQLLLLQTWDARQLPLRQPLHLAAPDGDAWLVLSASADGQQRCAGELCYRLALPAALLSTQLRRSRRWPGGAARVAAFGAPAARWSLVDLSEYGVRLRHGAGARPALGEGATLLLDLPDGQRLRLDLRVCHRRERDGATELGCAIVALSARDAQGLRCHLLRCSVQYG
jgi:hypothetical protein